MNLCKNCKWVRPATFEVGDWFFGYETHANWGEAKCTHPKAKSPVTGRSDMRCETRRMQFGKDCPDWEYG